MRWVFLIVAIPGCLWIGSAEHDERKRSIDPGFELLDLTPDTWSACAGPPTFTVVGTVSAHHGGRTFDTWFEVDGKRKLGDPTTAEPDGSILFDVSPGDLAPGCTDSCPVSFVVGVSHLGFDDQVDVSATILGQTDPQVSQAALVAADGTIADLATLVPDANPAGSVQQADWPYLAMGIVDPYLFAPGADLLVQFVLCPEGVSPATDIASCVVADALPSATVLAGDVTYEVPTDAFATAGCDPANIDVQWTPYLVLENHPCASSGLLMVDSSLRLVLPDCDADGYTVDTGDCDDDDPTRNPGADEVWYDGIDQDCDEADDFDRDGDGVLGGPKGPDCDDTDALTYPGALEICDDADNDCDGTQLVGVVTVESGVGPAQYDTFEEALAAASGGDTIRICPGTFTGSFVIDQDLSIYGSGPDASILRPDVQGRPVIDIVGAVDVTLEGVEVTGGTDVTGTLRGGGIRASAVNSLDLRDVRVIGNTAEDGAGLLLGGTVDLSDVTVTNNNASSYGGGIFIERDAYISATNLLVNGNTANEGGGVAISGFATLDMASGGSRIENNTAAAGGGLVMLDDSEIYGGEVLANIATEGGGIYAHIEEDMINSVPYIDGTRIADHLSPGLVRGGAISAYGNVMELFVVDSVLENNSVSGEGGAIAVESFGITAATLYIEGSTIRDNSAGDGGGVYAVNVFMYVVTTEFDGNNAAQGGGMYTDVFYGLVEADFTSNVATGDGGGLYAGFGEIWNYYDPAQFIGNSANRGGGLYLDDGWFVAPDVVLSGNSATDRGGGVYLTGGGHMGMWGSGSVSGNTSGIGEGDGSFVAFTADSFVSCDTMSWSDSVGCGTTPTEGVPANNCFSVYPTGLDDGQCDICP